MSLYDLTIMSVCLIFLSYGLFAGMDDNPFARDMINQRRQFSYLAFCIFLSFVFFGSSSIFQDHFFEQVIKPLWILVWGLFFALLLFSLVEKVLFTED